MVRAKNLPKKISERVSSVHNIVGDLIVHCVAAQYQSMVVTKCHACELAVNRDGEGRPGIKCKDCSSDHCNKCAGLTVEQ